MLGSTKAYLGRSSHYKRCKRCNREVDMLSARRPTVPSIDLPARQNPMACSERDEEVMREIRSLGCNLPAPFLRVASTHQIRCRRCLAKNAKHAKKSASLKPIVVVDRRGVSTVCVVCCCRRPVTCLYVNIIQAYLPNHGTWFHF